MKPGDSLWFFNGKETIYEFILTEIDQKDGRGIRLLGHLPGKVNERVLLNMPYLVFASREELCEHYRKIFEL